MQHYNGAMTLSTMPLSIMLQDIMNFSIATLSTKTLNMAAFIAAIFSKKDIQQNNTRHNETDQNNMEHLNANMCYSTYQHSALCNKHTRCWVSFMLSLAMKCVTLCAANLNVVMLNVVALF